MSYFENQKGLTICTNENKPLTFSIPIPEASPVLFKGQVQTRSIHALTILAHIPSFIVGEKWSGGVKENWVEILLDFSI